MSFFLCRFLHYFLPASCSPARYLPLGASSLQSPSLSSFPLHPPCVHSTLVRFLSCLSFHETCCFSSLESRVLGAGPLLQSALSVDDKWVGAAKSVRGTFSVFTGDRRHHFSGRERKGVPAKVFLRFWGQTSLSPLKWFQSWKAGGSLLPPINVITALLEVSLTGGEKKIWLLLSTRYFLYIGANYVQKIFSFCWIRVKKQCWRKEFLNTLKRLKVGRVSQRWKSCFPDKQKLLSFGVY